MTTTFLKVVDFESHGFHCYDSAFIAGADIACDFWEPSLGAAVRP